MTAVLEAPPIVDDSIESLITRLDTDEIEAWLHSLPHDQVAEIPSRPWWYIARHKQLPPPGKWRWWLACAGRGFGKTRSCAEWVIAKARRYPGARIALVAQTFGDGRDVMVEGESGLLSVLRPEDLRGGTVEAAWNRSMGELLMSNGSRFKIYTSERPRQLRGPQHHFAWGDEPAYWLDADRGTLEDSTWSNLNFGLRLPARPGWDDEYRAQAVLATTPRRVALLRVPDQQLVDRPETAGLMQRPDVLVVTGATAENLANLSSEYRTAVIDPLVGTRLGRQELDAVILDDVDGALWTSDLLDADRVQVWTGCETCHATGLVPGSPAGDGVMVEVPCPACAGERRVVAVNPTTAQRVAAATLRAGALVSIVIGFDPAVTVTATSDETGIIACGRGADGHDYTLADRSGRIVGNAAARAAWALFAELQADRLVYEANQGGEWVKQVLVDVWKQMQTEGYPGIPANGDAPVEAVVAKRSKQLRAQPIANRSEQHRTHHVGRYPTLEGQQTEWVAESGTDSPDRLDAYVYAETYLRGAEGKSATLQSPNDVRLPGGAPVRAAEAAARRDLAVAQEVLAGQPDRVHEVIEAVEAARRGRLGGRRIQR